MPNEFVAKNGLISQGNITATGSLVVSQNISASNISASGTISASVFSGAHTGSTFGTSSWASNALTTSNVNGGTNTYLARWTGNTSLSTGLIRDNGTDLGIGTTPASVYGIYHTRTSIETTSEIAGYNLTITNPNTGSTVLQTFRATSLYNAPTASSITGICSDFLSYTQVNSSGSLYGKIWQFYAGGFVLTGSVTDKTSFYAANAAIGVGATVTTEQGLYVGALAAGTTIYGIRSVIAASATRWNLYLDGTAKNYIAGNVGIGTSTSVNKLDVVGNISCSVITASLFSGSLSGSVFGTSSWATNALTAALATSINFTASNATLAQTASFILASGVSGTVTSASYALSASFAPVNTNITASWSTNALTASSINFTASNSTLAQTASNLIVGNSYRITNLTASNISCSGYLQSAAAAYQQITSSTFDSASYSDQWVRIAKFDYSLPSTSPAGGYFNEFALKINAIPVNGAALYGDRFVSPAVALTGSNKGNYVNLLIANASYGPLPAINVLNAWSYSTPLVTKIRTAKDSGNSTWYVDAFITNQVAGAIDLMRVESDAGLCQLQWQLNPSTASYTSSVEFDITKPGVKNALTYVYNFDGNVTSSGNILVGGRVGVGTTNPSNPLGINGAASFGSYASTTAPANGIIVSGNVGIGTSTVVNKLDVAGNISCSVITASLFSGSLSGSVFGTSSWATNALTAAFLPVGTYNITSSWATNSLTASSVVGTVTSASYAVSSSFSTTAGALVTTNNYTVANLTSTGTSSLGYVGIGVSPTSNLHVVENTSTGSRIQLGLASSNVLMSSGSTNDLLILNAPYGPSPGTTSNIGAKWGIKFIGGITSLDSNQKTSAIYAVSEDSLGYNRGTSLAFYTNQLNDVTYAERMRIYHNGNVGIGTTSPSASLHIKPTSLGANGFILERYATAAKLIYAYESAADGYLEVRSGTDVIVSKISGYASTATYFQSNVGIGTTSPNNKLEVAGTSGTAIISVNNISANRSSSFGIDNMGAYLQNSTNGDYFDFRNATGTANLRLLHNTNTYLNTTYTSVGSLVSSGSKLSVFGNLSVGSTYGSTASPTDGAIFEGNVGIGTTNPTNKLNVVGNISCSAITASLFFGTSSWATNALTAAFLPVGTYSITSSWATNSLTASSLVIANNYQVATLSINTSSVLLPLTVHGTTYSASISGQAANSIFRIGGAGTNAILDMGVNADVAPGFSWLQARSKIDYSSFSNLSLNSVGGNVGVGTTTPTAILEVSSSTALTVFNVKGAGGTNLFTISGSGNIGVGTTPSTTYKMQINGGFSATTKSFDIEHPTKLGKRLVYGSLESPYHGVRLTGKGKLVKGKGVIQLPDYMKSLVDYETVNVQITNIKHNKVIYVDDINEKNNRVSVAAKVTKTQLNKELEFYWTFTAIRKDVPNLQVEL